MLSVANVRHQSERVCVWVWFIAEKSTSEKRVNSMHEPKPTDRESSAKLAEYYRAIFFSSAILCLICYAYKMQMCTAHWSEKERIGNKFEFWHRLQREIFHSDFFFAPCANAGLQMFAMNQFSTKLIHETMTFFGCNFQAVFNYRLFCSIFWLRCQ